MRKAVKKIRLFLADRYLSLVHPGWVSTNRLRLALKPAHRRNDLQLAVQFSCWPANQMEEFLSLMKKEFPGHCEEIIGRADKHLEGQYRFLEEQPRNLKETGRDLAKQFGAPSTYLPWHYDWIHPYRWDPAKTYLKSRYEDLDGIDPKIPWELSRFGHLLTLAQGACLTERQDFLEEIARQLEDWHQNNPPGFGINWSNTMEVGMRAAHVLFAVGLAEEPLKRHPAIKERIETLMPSFVFNHALHILKNLESPTNHLLGDLSGLVILSRLYPYFEHSEHWGKLAIGELERQINVQVYPDGMDFEASTSYHRLVTEFFLYSWLIAGHAASPGYTEKLGLMLKAIDVFTKPDATIIQMGDNDSGRFLPLSPERAALDSSCLLFLGALLFPDLASRFSVKPSAAPEAFWLLGPAALKEYRITPPPHHPPSSSPLYEELPDGGIYVLKNIEKNHYLAITMPKNGQLGWGGHAHNDRLGFHLSLNGEDILVDPGTGVYLRNKALRDELRCTKSHNTLMLDNQEQNRIQNGPFRMSRDIGEIKRIQSSLKEDGSLEFCAQHDGYLRLPVPLIHRRRFKSTFGPGRAILEIQDQILDAAGKGSSVPAFWNFTLAPDIKIERQSGGIAVLKTQRGRAYEFQAQFPWEAAQGKYSPEFGVITATTRLIARATISVPSTHTFIFKEL